MLLISLLFGLPIWALMHMRNSIKKESSDMLQAYKKIKKEEPIVANTGKAPHHNNDFAKGMLYLIIFGFSLAISYALFGYKLPSEPTSLNGNVFGELLYAIAHTPIYILITALIISTIIGIITNRIASSLISKWNKIKWVRDTHEKELNRQHQQAIREETFKILKQKAENGENLTAEEEKFLRYMMGPVWYASLKRKRRVNKNTRSQ